jgi:L-fuconolactonase
VIVDAHVHYWEPATGERPWDPAGLASAPPVPLSVEELLATPGVEAVCGITLRLMGEDNRYALESADRFPDRIAAVFGRIDPRGADLDERLRKLVQHPKVTGVRFTLFAPDEVAWLVNGTLDRFLDRAAAHRLLVAIYCARPRELGALAARHPDCTVLADHLALDHRRLKRDPDADVFAPWEDVLALSAVPNLYLKATNLPELSREPFPYADVVQRVRAVYERFGPARLIWGSNFPPSADRASYAESVQFFRDLPFIPAREKEQIMGGNLVGMLRG